MKTYKIIKISFLAVGAFLALTSCSGEFLDVNDNPNNPLSSTPGVTLPAAEQSFTSLNATTMTYLGEFFTYTWSTPSNWSANSDLIRYNVTNSFFSTIFETSYATILKDLTYIQNFDDGLRDYRAFDAISSTMKAFQYQYLVDLYGDVPFTEANQREFNLTPAYDDAETVYKANIDSLTVAADISLSDLPENALVPTTSQDIIFRGNLTRWAQFANTIKLRMLIRLSGTNQNAYIQGEVDKIVANGAGFIAADVVANPGYSDNAGKQSPFYGYIGRGPNNTSLDRNRFTVATDYVLNVLTTTNDPRRARLFTAVGGNFKGAPQVTILPGTGFTENDLSHVGPGLLVSSAQDQKIMLAAESLFLQAEATLKGYLPGGEAAAGMLYNQAITASFTSLAVPTAATAAMTYYNQAIPNVNFAASPNKLEAIITQKWIALNGTNGIEPWIELTRTGFPANLPIPAESDGVRPVRLLYPASEVARNTANVPSQSLGDAFTKPPFWKQ